MGDFSEGSSGPLLAIPPFLSLFSLSVELLSRFKETSGFYILSEVSESFIPHD